MERPGLIQPRYRQQTACLQLIFNSLSAPTVYSLGDNEWADSYRTSNGSYDPLERLAFLRQQFFSRNYSQGYNPIRLHRQGELGQTYSENSRFVKKGVEFVAIHIPGSNNNLVATDSQCTKKSDRGPTDCAAATAEYVARNAKNVEWLKASFAEARQRRQQLGRDDRRPQFGERVLFRARRARLESIAVPAAVGYPAAADSAHAFD